MSQEINNELELIRSILRGYKPSMARDDALYATARVKRLVGQDRAQRGEPVAWRWENKNIKGNWYLSWSKPDARFNQRALYEHPQPAHTEADVQELMEFAKHHALGTFSDATIEDKFRRVLGVPKP